MNWNQATFETAFATAKQLPECTLPEVCFAGRSNVGKSSLLNCLFGRKALARTSSKPGKTATVNFYRLGERRLVDLPGYGYAKVSGAERERWGNLMEHYFAGGRTIRQVYLLIDLRHPPTADDRTMLDFLENSGVPFRVVLTKADKLNKTEREAALSAVPEWLGQTPFTVFSAKTGEGREELRAEIEQLFEF